MKCPFCDFEVKTSRKSAIYLHVKYRHPLKECPVCGYRGRDVLKHLAAKAIKAKCREHMFYFGFYCRTARSDFARKRAVYACLEG